MKTYAHQKTRLDHPVHQGLHLVIYRGIIGLALWFVLSVWLLFNTGAYVGLTFAIITVIFAVIVAIPLLLWTSWRHNAAPSQTRVLSESFKDWAQEDFATWTGGLSGHEAATQILLPISAVCIGITIFGLVFYFDVPHPG